MLRKIAYSLLRKSNKVCGRFRFATATSLYSLLRKGCTAYQRTAVITSLQNIKTTLQYLYNRHASGYDRHSCALLLYSFITSLTFVFLHKYYGLIPALPPLRSGHNKV